MMIRDEVFELLTNALENLGRDSPFFQQPNEMIADDMIECGDSFKPYQREVIIPHIQTWKVVNGLASD